MFEGKYYNGRISQGMPAFIILEEAGIRIRYNTGDAEGEVFWDLPGLQKSEFNDATTLLSYGRFPQQTVAVYEQGFEEALRTKYKNAPFLKSAYSSFLKTGLTGLVVGGLVALGLLVVLFVWGVPALADRAAMHFPQQYEQQLGEQLYRHLLSSYTVDEAKTEALNSYLQALQTDPGFPVKATVVESDVANAFAVPGGFVVVHDALLDKMERHEELAGLLGHELAHVQLRHSTRALTRSLSYYMLLSLLFGDVSGISAVIVDNASALRNLEYSRRLETEADKAGLQLLRQNQLNSEGMVWLLERLSEHDSAELSDFLSTHPNSKDRIQAIKEQIENENKSSAPNPQLEQHWQKLKSDSSR